MRVVGIQFRNSPKTYYFSPQGLEDLELGEFVIVETTRGQEAGQVAFAPREVSEEEIPGKLKDILRKATALDLTLMEKYHQREEGAMLRCQEKANEYGLPMKVIRAEYNFNGTHLTFYFTSERRVDFRALVQDLARTFRTRIELRQIGVRDEVKLLGGYGKCGRIHCCATWLTDFRPISIRMAKLQELPLSPMEISGTCGRLLCCLAYENDFYTQVKAEMPTVGRTIDTQWGPARVVSLNALQESVTVELQDQTTVTLDVGELACTQSPSQAQPQPEPKQEAPHRQRARKKGDASQR